MSQGFLIVASRDRAFLGAAIRCARSIHDEWPAADVCIATHRAWADAAAEVADRIITPIPDHTRAKLWALARTPYARTQYVDADMYCLHPDVRTIFEVEPDAPVVQTRNRAYCSKVVYFNARRSPIHHREGAALHAAGQCHRLEWHCGFLRYDRAALPLMRDWLDMLGRNHREGPGPWGPPGTGLEWWDTYAYWRCWQEREYDFAVTAYPEPDARWQYISGHYRDDELMGHDPVFDHYTIPHAARALARGDGDIGRLR